jgi:hypothetical protein
MHTTTRTNRPVSIGVLAFSICLVMLAPARATAQEPVAGFDQLSTRLRVGDTIWVTDTSGAEVKGTLSELTSTSLTLKGARHFQRQDVRAILERPHDSLKFGALLGLGIGLAAGTVLVAVATPESAGDYFSVAIIGGMGAAIGAGIDAAIPMPKRPVYLSNVGSSRQPVSWRPMVGPRATGVQVSFSF